MVVKRKNKWCVVSKKAKRNLGCYSTQAEAKQRLRQVEFFKRQKK